LVILDIGYRGDVVQESEIQRTVVKNKIFAKLFVNRFNLVSVF